MTQGSAPKTVSLRIDSGKGAAEESPHGLTAAVIRYYRISILFAAGLLVWGLLVFFTLPRAEDPEFDAGECRIVTRFPGAAPDKVENLVSRPLEEAVEELRGVRTVASESYAGFSLVRVILEDDAVPAEVLERMREQIDDTRRDLPAEAEEPLPFKYNLGDIPITIISLSGPDDYRQLSEWAERLREELRRLDDVARVAIEGRPERQITVSVDNQRLSQLRVPLTSIWEILRRENSAVPGGSLDVGPRWLQLRNPNEYRSIAEIGDTVVGSVGGSIVHLRSTAAVIDGFAEVRHRVRTNGRTAVLLTVQKRPGSNTVAVAEQVRQVVARMRERLPEPFGLSFVTDRGAEVAKLLGGLGINALLGGLLVVGLVSLFLGLRQGLVVTVAIPLSVLITFILMQGFAIDLNQVSIFGMVLALGMLVDSGLVVVESIDHRIEEGQPLFTAVVNGLEDVRTPVISSALTTVAAFIPMLMLSGELGRFIYGLPMTVIFALSGSVLVALSIIPLLSYTSWKSFPPRQRSKPPSVLAARFLRGYTELAKTALRHRWLTLLLAGIGFVLALLVIPRLGLELFPSSEKSLFLINVRLPRQANLETTNLVTAQVEEILAAEQQIRSYTVNIGRGSPQVYYNVMPELEQPSFAQVVVDLAPGPLGVERFVAELRAKLQRIAGASVEPQILEQGPVRGAAIQVRVLGDSTERLTETAAAIRERIAGVPGLVDLRDTLGEQIPRLSLELNKEKAALLGVDSYSFSATIFMALNGQEASRYRAGGDDIPIVVRLSEQSLQQVSDLEQLYLPSRSGGVVPFAEVASAHEEMSFAQINRRDGLRVVTVEAGVSGRLADEVLRDVQARLAELQLPEGYELELGGEQEERMKSFAGLEQALVVALLLIYMVLAIQFNSFIQPFVILATVPFGIIGAVFGLLITGNPFGFMAFIGIISLTGIIINDSIVLADHANYLQRVEGKRLYEALLLAGRRRFRPVVLTSITTIGGLTPLAIWGGSLWSPLASAVIFGLLGSTILILIVLPVIYSLMVRQKEGEREQRLLRKLVS